MGERLERRVCLSALGFATHQFVPRHSASVLASGDLDGNNNVDLILFSKSNDFYREPRLTWQD
jgi:hypothetical protein